VTPKTAATDARRHLRLIAGELGVNLKGISDDDLNIVAIRFVMDDRLTADALQAIVDDVRAGSGQAKEAVVGDPLAATQEPALPPARSKPGYRFNSTEADRRQRHKLAMQHLSESARTGLYVVPRRPDPLPVDKPHPACLVAARERRGTVCDRCLWLLDDNPYTDAWLDRDDDTGGRL
jgi:hypothetical protein